MANNSEFYRGKRKKTAPALIGTIIILAVIAFAIMLFYGVQKYIVISNDGLHLEIPFLQDADTQTEPSDISPTVQSFAPVDAVLEVGAPDYSNVSATAGEGLEAVKAVYIPADSVSAAGIDTRLAEVNGANAVLIDAKTVSGMLVWNSETDIAKGYGTAGTVDLKSIVSGLKDRDIYVAVRLCCFVDNTLASRYTQLALRTSDGAAYSDTNGAWLDPTNAVVKGYILSLCKELSKMGVDEVVLHGMRLPDTAGLEFAFSSTSAVKPTPVSAISGFAINMSRSMRSSTAKLSVQLTSRTAMSSGSDSVTGQNAEIFFKVFERVYITSDADSAANDVSAAEGYISLGEPKMRLVPICSDGAPGTDCWVVMK